MKTAKLPLEMQLSKLSLPSSRFSFTNEQDLLRLQQYQCAGCGETLQATLFGLEKNYALCRFFGCLFCKKWCHKGHNRLIPFRLLHFWDFKEYPVSKMAASMIDKIWAAPMFHIVEINPLLVEGVPALQQVLFLQTKITEYLPLASKHEAGNLIEFLEEEVTRDHIHLVTSLGLFSIGDLVAIQQGELAKLLFRIYSECSLLSNSARIVFVERSNTSSVDLRTDSLQGSAFM